MQKPSHSHEHEFLIDGGDEITAEFDGRYVMVGIQCRHEPILNSVTDDARDETYYETGPQCEARQVTYVAVSEPVGVDSGVVVTYDENYDLWNDIVDELAEAIKEAASVDLVGYNADKEACVVTNDREPENYRVDLEVEDVEVNH